jgi:hypothetical protein
VGLKISDTKSKDGWNDVLQMHLANIDQINSLGTEIRRLVQQDINILQYWEKVVAQC